MATKKKALKEELLNVPNMLTMARVVVIPVFILFLYWGDPMSSYVAAVIFSLAAITDVVDGWLARRMGIITVFGKFMDPMADKLIVMSALVMLVRLGRVSSGLVIALIAREFMINGLRTLAASEGMVIAAGQGGKWKTALQLTAILCLLVHYTYPMDFVFFTLNPNFNRAGTVLLWLSLIASVLSALEYFKGYLELVLAKDAKEPGQG